MKLFKAFIIALAFPGAIVGQCLSDLLPELPETKTVNHKMAGEEKVVSFFYEVDYYTFQAFGNMQETLDWAKRGYERMAEAYASEGISTALSYVLINTSPDWSNGITDPDLLLFEFSRVRKNENRGRIKLFLTLKGSFVGLAWINQFDKEGNQFNSSQCPNGVCHFGPYGINMRLENNPSTGWDREVLTHEAGHIFSLEHSFACKYGINGNQALTACRASCSVVSAPEDKTWMSYCNAGDNGFGPTHLAQLKSKIKNSPRNLLDGVPIIMYVASDIKGDYTYTEEVIFHEGYCGNSSDLTITKQ